LLADHRRRCVVAAVELFACGLLGADALRSARAALGLGDSVGRQQAEADPRRVVVWALAEPDVGRSYRELLGAAVLFLGTGGDRFRRAVLLTRRAVAAADRVLRERRGRGPGRAGKAGGDAAIFLDGRTGRGVASAWAVIPCARLHTLRSGTAYVARAQGTHLFGGAKGFLESNPDEPHRATGPRFWPAADSA
jgi:hypothetical protein